MEIRLWEYGKDDDKITSFLNIQENEHITVRLVQDNDIDQLIDLYEEVWPDVNYDKKSKANFVLNESSGINYCAEYKGKIVGSRTSFYINAYYGDRKLKCVQIGDSCVSKSCRGRGLFQQMNRYFLQDFFPDGELIYNISVQQSKVSYEKLGWVYIKSLTSIFKITKPMRTLLKIRFDIRNLSGPRNWETQQGNIDIPEELLKVREDNLRARNLIHINYDSDTFKWRLKTMSGIKCFSNEIGCVVYKKGVIKHSNLSVVEIGDIFLYEYDKKSFKAIMSDFIKFAKPEIVQTSICYNHPLYNYYKKYHFIDNPRHKYLHHGVRVNSDEMRSICLNPDNWGICTLDIDTF